MADNSQPLIIDEVVASSGRPIQNVPIAIGVVQGMNYNNQYNNQYGNQYGNQYYQGQPPNMYPNPPSYNPNNPYAPNAGQYQNRPLGPPAPPARQGVPQPLPPQMLNHPQIVMIQQKIIQVCPSCGFLGSIPRQSAGCVTFSWCVCLFFFTGLFCFWVPFCIDGCYDVEIVCSRCGFVKAVIQANCM